MIIIRGRYCHPGEEEYDKTPHLTPSVYANFPHVMIKDNKVDLRHVKMAIKGCRTDEELQSALRGAGIPFEMPTQQWDWFRRTMFKGQQECNVMTFGMRSKV